MIIGIGVGGDFLDGPSESDVWNYPDAEQHFDYIKWYDYTGIGGTVPPVVPPVGAQKCEAKPNARKSTLCGNSKWACYTQKYAPNMSSACTSAWKSCCRSRRCSQEDIVKTVSAVYEQYDSQVKN